MKVNFIKFCLLCGLIVSLALGCKKTAKVEPLVRGDLRIDLLGDMVPSAVEMGKNSIATVVFAGSDQIYHFNLNRIDANSHWGRLMNAKNGSTTVKVYVTKQTEIVRTE